MITARIAALGAAYSKAEKSPFGSNFCRRLDHYQSLAGIPDYCQISQSATTIYTIFNGQTFRKASSQYM
jgi:hypothetical protein